MEHLPQKNIQADNTQANNLADFINITQVIDTLIDNKWLIIFFALVGFFVGKFLAFIAVPIYQADALLQIEEKRNSIVGVSTISDFSVLRRGALSRRVLTESTIIKSRNIAGKVVDELGLTIYAAPRYFPVVGKAMARVNKTTVLTEAPLSGLEKYAWGGERIQVTRLDVGDYQKHKSFVLVAKGNSEFDLFNSSQIKESDGDVLLTGRAGEAASGNGVKIFVAELNARPGTEFIVQNRNRLSAIRSTQGSIQAVPIEKTKDMLKIALQGQDQGKIVKIVNTITQLYQRQNVERTTKEANLSILFLQKQLPKVKEDIEIAEVRLNEFRSNNAAVDITIETKQILDQMVNLESKLKNIEITRNEMLLRYTEKHPLMIAIDKQEEKLQELLKEKKATAQDLPATQLKVLRFSRDIQVGNKIYSDLLNKVQELKVIKAGTIGNVRIIDSAVASGSPIKPNKRLIVLISLMIGTLIGVVLAVIHQIMSRGIIDPDSVEGKIGIPVYASIPLSAKQLRMEKEFSQNKVAVSVLAEYDSHDLSIEGLRSLRTNIHFALMETKSNIVMFTGPSPNVGKSFITVNFAHTLAQSGKKVLLIDADMRKGYINKTYRMARAPGLSNLIAGEATVEEIVHKSGFENVDIVTTGEIPPNPSELLMHKNFGEFLQKISPEYYMVLLDTPPILAVTDAAVIGQHAGTTFVLLRYGAHDFNEIEATIKRLQQNNIKPKGFIFNAMEAPRKYSYYGKYGYKYKYAHNYDYEYHSSK